MMNRINYTRRNARSERGTRGPLVRNEAIF